MTSIGVMQIIDTLETGGAERVAVNIANRLPRDRYRSFLCTTRQEGPLESAIAPSVERLRLKRTERFDIGAIRQLVQFVRENEICILHPHGASLFIAAIASRFAPGVRVIWHDHFGRVGTEERPVWLYRLACRRVAGVIAVNDALADWSRDRLRFAADRVSYVPNFVELSAGELSERPPANIDLPGTAGSRIVCVANFRPQKDHLNLVRALKRVVARVPQAHLLLIGPVPDNPHLTAIRAEIAALSLTRQVSFLGQRTDVLDVLRACDVGVLSSNSEGLPLSLLEYGAAGLAAVATDVGQCAEVLDHGAAGLLVPPSSPEALATGIIQLLESPTRRDDFASGLQERIRRHYSAESAIRQISQIYETALGQSAAARVMNRSDVRESHAITTKTN